MKSSVHLVLRACLFYSGVSLITIVFTLLSFVLLSLPYRFRYAVLTQWSAIVLWWLKYTCRLDYQIHDQNYDLKTPVIVLSKHQSSWETIAFPKLFPVQAWILKRELLWLPFFGWALATLRPIAINRRHIHQAMKQIIQQGAAHLAQGHWVVVFPEGTRVAPGEKKRYGIGGALLAAQTGYPVMPVAHNAGTFWPPRSFIKQPGTIQLVLGPLIESKGKTAQEINQQVETWIEQTVFTLSKQ